MSELSEVGKTNEAARMGDTMGAAGFLPQASRRYLPLYRKPAGTFFGRRPKRSPLRRTSLIEQPVFTSLIHFLCRSSFSSCIRSLESQPVPLVTWLISATVSVFLPLLCSWAIFWGVYASPTLAAMASNASRKASTLMVSSV